MAGHSKWANIKHRKSAQDAKRGKLFTKLIREITVAARHGGPDPETNPRLRLAFDNALKNNMTRDTIERAAKRGAGETEGEAYEELRYEGYGPGGAAIMVDCMTDNRNRTVSEVRHAFNKMGGNLGTDGSVAYLFEKKGVISFPPGLDEETVMEPALEGGAEDVLVDDDGSIEVITDPDAYQDVRQALLDHGLEPENSEVTMRPETLSPLDEETAETVLKLLNMLDDLDDVQNVYTNANFPEGVGGDG
ncbi:MULTISPECIES: YebC/PmpR family DNA-binding transcriptional regulator [unclassified Thioalkalivibrio]|uniref:YebC/PmpR family DNA-binding transcriptional regulator n=1 Tax=unclassified Thioalkalivibrio TaxID=2621013 RepID=UPI00036EE66A|nr:MULTISPECIES: YebC/PmpR family DNA-binding transcriptional regulator [unclassified Thioalkalivibrio]